MKFLQYLLLCVFSSFILINASWVDDELTNGIDNNKVLNCSCEDKIYCDSLGIALQKNASAPHVIKYLEKKENLEVFAFVIQCNYSTWSKFDWDKLTTIGLAGFYDQNLVCHAHKNGVRVVKLGNIPTNQLPNPSDRELWVRRQVEEVALNFLDGINIDFESAVDPDSPESLGLTQLVKETSEAFHKHIPDSQVSFDVAWNSTGVDKRFYDYAAIAKYSDLIFIMAYDMQSQIWTGNCTARPNSGIYRTASGILSYLKLNIPANKMVLGVPWYGYKYPCISLDKDETCYLKEVPFRGCNCSDAAGKEFSYDYLLKELEETGATRKWDKNTLTPYYTYKDETGQIYQVRYDDPQSLVYKYAQAIFYGLKGVGMWTANFLDYSDTVTGENQRNSMWNLLPPYKF